MTTLNSVVAQVTHRIIDRSATTRGAYRDRMAAETQRGPARGRLACANLAHGFAAAEAPDKEALRRIVKPNIAIVSSYNDMLSAHKPFEDYPAQLKAAALGAGAIAQFAGGVPAMCDGITQGRAGMQLSLFSRDVIAMSTAIALSHDMFDAALLLGVCDKIVPGMLIGALSFGHLPAIFVPAGPMTSGLPNGEKARVRQLYAEGKVDREALLDAEAASYHGRGTCTFYGTANSNQLLMEAMGLHLPGSSLVSPDTPLRDALTAAAGKRVSALTALRDEYTPIGEVVDERAVVNGAVALLATGGSTNHTMHLVAIARAAGIILTWNDIAELSAVVPLLARIYPNGKADVNHFQAAGGMGFLIGSLLDAGLMHDDVRTVAGYGLRLYTNEPRLTDGSLHWTRGVRESLDTSVLRGVEDPFAPDGGLKTLTGNLGTSVIKTSAVDAPHRTVTAPALVFDSQEEFLEAFGSGALDRDFIGVVRYQGPQGLGMPELHKLTPAMGVLQDRGYKVALVTDGRMSGASGKVPAAIHLTPEAAAGGPIGRLRDGDVITLDATTGTLSVDVLAEEFDSRPHTGQAPSADEWIGTGRELFASMRAGVGPADEGATIFRSAV